MEAGRNDPCPCGSGLKYKKCCYGKPPKLKFKAKVISSGGNLHQTIGQQNVQTEEFKMTEKDFRITK